MNDCPCCNGNMLRHVRNSRIYWFCPTCWQEMPNLTLANKINKEANSIQMGLDRPKATVP
jgi:hypothetical protein